MEVQLVDVELVAVEVHLVTRVAEVHIPLGLDVGPAGRGGGRGYRVVPLSGPGAHSSITSH